MIFRRFHVFHFIYLSLSLYTSNAITFANCSFCSANETTHLLRYDEHVHKLGQIKCDFVQKTWNEKEGKKEKYTEIIEGSLFLNSSNKCKHLIMDVTLEDESKNRKFSEIRQENIFTPDLNITCGIEQNDQTPLSLTSILDVKNITWGDQVYTMPIGCVLGYVSFQSEKTRYVPNLIHKATTTLSQDVVSGHTCTKIDGATENYSIALWIDPEHDFCMRKLTLVVNNPEPSMPELIEFIASDLIPVGSTYFPSSYTLSQTFPPYQIKSDHLPDYLEIERVINVPRQIRCKEVTITRCDLNVHFTSSDFLPLATIPNGSVVQMRDAPQIEYIWLDGKIVPKTDEAMLAIARGGHKFMPGPNETRFWLMGIGIALILFALGVKGYKMYKGISV